MFGVCPGIILNRPKFSGDAYDPPRRDRLSRELENRAIGDCDGRCGKKVEIRKYQETDWGQVWTIIEKVFRAGETYAFSPEITEEEAHKVWVQLPQETYVSIGQDCKIIGTYYIKPNQPGLGSHVCNCGYIVSESARGKGVATSMCEHSQQVAVKLGFRAMQYNLVASTNDGAIRLWKKLGFQLIGTLANAFKSSSSGYIDAHVMYKELKT